MKHAKLVLFSGCSAGGRGEQDSTLDDHPFVTLLVFAQKTVAFLVSVTFRMGFGVAAMSPAGDNE